MLILILSIIINLSLVYLFYKRIMHRIEFPQEKEFSEINSLMIEFNKLTKNNIDLIEEKIEELKKVIKIADEKILQLSEKIGNTFDINKITKPTISSNKLWTSTKTKKADVNLKVKKMDKYKTIQKLLKKNKSPEEIADFLGISISEVKLYINLIKNKKST